MKNWNWLKGCLSALILSAGLLAGCNNNTVTPAKPDDKGQPIMLPTNSSELIHAQNQYTFQFFKKSVGYSADSNVLVSPLSLYLNLSMVYNGAAGSTQTGMAKALQLKDTGKALLNQVNHSLITGLPKVDPQVKISIANSIWYRNSGAQPLTSFLDTNTKYYQAKVTGADFSPATVDQINNWVASATHQKIKTILHRINPDDIMYLINAIYFNGKWKYKFDPSQTRLRPFHSANHANEQVQFMTQKATFNYLHNSLFSLIQLPYGNGSFNMYVLLPHANRAIPAAVISSLNVDKFSSLIKNMDSANVKLWLPKWEYSYAIPNLKPLLSRLGMGIAFQPGQADFSAMYPPAAGAYISQVKQKTYIKVDEKGTEAAAVTSTGMSTTSTTTHPKENVMDVDHPFLYLITEKKTGAVLFIGIVNNLQSKGAKPQH